MRVLHVLGELRHSGAEIMLEAAGPTFADLGVESELLSTGAEVGGLTVRLEAVGYRVHHVPFAKTLRYFLRVYRLMRDGRYDVIHLHTERANFWFGLIALAARPKRVVRTIHNVFSFEGGLRRRRGAQRRVLHRLGVQHVACSASIERNERTRFGLVTRLVPNWYDSLRFHPRSDRERLEARRSLGVSDTDTVLVSVGNCSPVKNHAALIGALSRLQRIDGLVYLHAGEEEPGHPERRLAGELGLEDEVRFLGSLDDVPTIFSASDVFVMPSLYEGFPVSVLEALACGMPAVLADVPGLRDFREIYPSLRFAEPTAESFAEVLETLLSSSEDDIRSEASGYADATLEQFGIDAGVERYLRLYEGAA
jgi:glycosyltransferase involved in cell wall biosynthesis